LIKPTFKAYFPAKIARQVFEPVLGTMASTGYDYDNTFQEEHEHKGNLDFLVASIFLTNRAMLKLCMSLKPIPFTHWLFRIANLSHAIQCTDLLSRFPLHKKLLIRDVSFIQEPLDRRKQLMLYVDLVCITILIKLDSNPCSCTG
jgi:hypothetical protein